MWCNFAFGYAVCGFAGLQVPLRGRAFSDVRDEACTPAGALK
jgi:hypothetical protein